MNNLPVDTETFYKEDTVLDMAMIVDWNKAVKKYNFQVLPKTAIISLSKHVLDRKTRFFSKKVKGITGQHYIINKNILFCSGFGNGAPAIVGLMEELRILGVGQFIFVGVAASLTEGKTADVFLVTNTYSTTGCTTLYAPGDSFKPFEDAWFMGIKDKLNLPQTICWSTDAPFRETISLLEFFTAKGAKHVDMECAAVYAFAQFYKLGSLCIVVTADSLVNNNWAPPQNRERLNRAIKDTVSGLIATMNG